MKECVCINLSLIHNNNFRQLYRRNLKKIYYARSGMRYMSDGKNLTGSRKNRDEYVGRVGRNA